MTTAVPGRVAERSTRPRPPPATLAASVALLFGLAVTAPVLEVLGDNPEFFVARATPRVDAIVTAVTFGVAFPAALAAVVWMAARLNDTAGLAVHAGVVAALSLALGFRLLDPVVGNVWFVTVASLVAAGLLTVGLRRLPSTWSVVHMGGLAPAAVVALFVFASPASALVTGAQDVDAIQTGEVADVPVTVVALDELPTASLLAGPDRIDGQRFPNLAAFAEDAVWYRNATTVSDRTSQAVPAVFTGKLPAADQLPIAADHPVSLFTLLAASHDVRAVQPVTRLCPGNICGQTAPTAAGPSGPGALASDVGLIAAHGLLPDEITDGLARIDQTWGNFGQVADAGPTDTGGEPGEGDGGERDDGFSLVSRMDASVAQDRRDDFAGVVASDGGSRPPAYLLHAMLPHVPFRLLPSGQAVYPTPLAGLGDDEVWDDAWLADHAQANHLLQAGFTDRLLGRVFDDLKAAGVYEDGLVVVVADHGVSFEAGTHRRRIGRDNLAQIASVPLLVKYPDRPGGVIDRRPAQTVDVVPTVLDVLGITPPDDLDGVSLLADRDPPGEPSTRTVDGLEADPSFSVAEADPWPVARAIRETFGDGWRGVYRHGRYREIIGRSVDELDTSGDTSMTVAVDRLEAIRTATSDDDPIVGVVSGGLGYPEDQAPTRETFIAIAFDDRIAAVGRSYDHTATTAPFLALVPPSAYAGEVDEVAVYWIRGDDSSPVLAELTQP